MTLSYNNYLKKNFKDMYYISNNLKDITSKDIKNENVKDNFLQMNTKLGSNIKNLLEEVNKIDTMLEFEDYNIAFFGETNAGKSTIIEALINGDGNSIGDGRKDFTQELTTYKLRKVNLLDLPGMEGNESKYISEIKKGIAKAHAVIYVSSGDKEPEDTTLEKIKNYLKDQTDIYSVINIRKPLNPHTLRTGLINDNQKIVIQSTENKFKKVFGKNFKKIIPLNANIGFICRTRNKNEEIKTKLDQMIKYIGTSKDVYKFSNFESLNHIIKKLDDIELQDKKIKISNTYKFLSINDNIISLILNSKKELDSQIRTIENENNELNKEIDKEREIIKKKLTQTINRNIDNLHSRLSNLIIEANENNISEKEIEKIIKKEIQEFNKTLKDDINKDFKLFQEKIKHLFDEMNEQIMINLKYSKIDNDYINIDDIVKDMSVNLSRILKSIGTFFLTLIPSILGGIPMIIVTAVSSIISLGVKWKFIDKKHDEAIKRKELLDSLDIKMKKIKNKLNQDIQKNSLKIDKLIEKQLKVFANNLSNIKSLSKSMNYQINKLNYLKVNVSTKLVEIIENSDYFYAFIDTKMNSIFYIGEDIKNKSLFNQKVYLRYSSINEFLSTYENTIKDGYIYVKQNEEFQKRAISELIKKLNMSANKVIYKGVKKTYVNR